MISYYHTYIWFFTGAIVLFSLLFIRLLGYTLSFTKNKYFWIVLHIIWFSWGGFILPLKYQLYLFIFSIVFELFELISCLHFTKELCSNLHPTNTSLVMIHDIIMNLSAQIMGLSLSGRFINYLNLII